MPFADAWPGQARLTLAIGVSQSYLSTIGHGEGKIGAAVLLALTREFERSIAYRSKDRPPLLTRIHHRQPIPLGGEGFDC